MKNNECLCQHYYFQDMYYQHLAMQEQLHSRQLQEQNYSDNTWNFIINSLHKIKIQDKRQLTLWNTLVLLLSVICALLLTYVMEFEYMFTRYNVM